MSETTFETWVLKVETLIILANIANMWLGKYSAKRQLETIEETNKKEKLDDGVKVLSSWGNIFHNFQIIWL